MRLHVFCGEDLFAGQIFQPPGMAPLGSRLGPPHEGALTHDSDELVLLVDDGDGADAVGAKNTGHLLDSRIRANANDGRNHHVSGFHVAYPLPSGDIWTLVLWRCL